MRRLIIRISLIIVVILFSMLLFYLGKTHDVVLDNLEVNEYASFDYVNVYVDGKLTKLEYNAVGTISVVGPWHNIKIEPLDMDEKVLTDKIVERSFNLDMNAKTKNIVLPLIKKDNKESEWLKDFVPAVQ